MSKTYGANYSCAVKDCTNNIRGIRRWKLTYCEIHRCPHGAVQHGCVCPPPFTFFAFPTERADPDGRKKWVNRIKRIDITSNKQWTPKVYSRVCNEHFVDKKPTEQNLYPSLNLGHNPSDISKTMRKAPRDRKPRIQPQDDDEDLFNDDIPPSPPQPNSDQDPDAEQEPSEEPPTPIDDVGEMEPQMVCSESSIDDDKQAPSRDDNVPRVTRQLNKDSTTDEGTKQRNVVVYKTVKNISILKDVLHGLEKPSTGCHDSDEDSDGESMPTQRKRKTKVPYTRRCCVRGCPMSKHHNLHEGYKDDITCYTFPSDSQRCKSWVKSLHLEAYFQRKKQDIAILHRSYYRVCALHFEKSQLVKGLQGMHHQDAIPVKRLAYLNETEVEPANLQAALIAAKYPTILPRPPKPPQSPISPRAVIVQKLPPQSPTEMKTSMITSKYATILPKSFTVSPSSSVSSPKKRRRGKKAAGIQDGNTLVAIPIGTSSSGNNLLYIPGLQSGRITSIAGAPNTTPVATFCQGGTPQQATPVLQSTTHQSVSDTNTVYVQKPPVLSSPVRNPSPATYIATSIATSPLISRSTPATSQASSVSHRLNDKHCANQLDARVQLTGPISSSSGLSSGRNAHRRRRLYEESLHKLKAKDVVVPVRVIGRSVNSRGRGAYIVTTMSPVEEELMSENHDASLQSDHEPNIDNEYPVQPQDDRVQHIKQENEDNDGNHGNIWQTEQETACIDYNFQQIRQGDEVDSNIRYIKQEKDETAQNCQQLSRATEEEDASQDNASMTCLMDSDFQHKRRENKAIMKRKLGKMLVGTPLFSK
ncbi:uncharacterized protein [Amphiura filiformis]|uniref:uncharacterized protein n=1 Tax=Amphiura filiformis TaxID=82378 RepID=UPI003B20C53D